ncbi:MAG: hypothetical protein J6A42_04445 [Firmicutes bacterium]|nr:hypothetical protein [Bacillota bacterium]
MKKWFAIFLAAAMIFGLAACTSSETAPETEQEPEVVRSDVPAEDQIDVIVANKDLWLEPAENYATFYAVTDLNNNGRLELIRCAQSGEWWSEDAFFEMSLDGKTLEALAFPFGDEYSHPDLVDHDEFPMYIGQEGCYLIATDDIFMGPVQQSDYQNYHVLDCLMIAEGTVEAGDLAWCMAMTQDTNADGLEENHIWYYGPEDEGMDRDGEWYVNAPAERFAGYNESVCSIAWWTPDTFETPEDDYTDEALNVGLHYSWDGFGVREDAEVFASLIEDPYYSFYAAGAGGAHIYRADEEVPYFPSFLDLYGTWYIQYAWNDDGITYMGAGLSASELEILSNGLLYAGYSNENDPRGAYLFTEMRMVSDAKADGTDADDWVVVYESDDGLWQMQLRPDPENQMLYVTWYEWTEADHSDEPTGMNLVYSRTAG